MPTKSELSRLDENKPATLSQLRTGTRESDPGQSLFSNDGRQHTLTSKQKAALSSTALRLAQQQASAPVSAQATLGSLASMLMACSVLQARFAKPEPGRIVSRKNQLLI